ncbi:DUF4159 domain-containing protein [Acetobacter fabarum]|uniref:DUF4159 domain-containing protein n=1 Tax=Acetobacter fabarum TaxID=483199 RepID=UPI00209CB6AD|nr:DUF4159 domain-containing protein [Acetobacter fabarum]MCP1227121.1 DUF4159 domain-containing protein [Acetobacter fabarum]MCP1232635.1 DUF4159 domain-containing protein [Acetobacter fabarum]
MIFQFPALLFALLCLPLVWWLLRATPPRARQQVFPPIAFLARLRPKETEAARSPPWVLLLRLLAVGLLITGFARPFIPGSRNSTQTPGPVLLVVDDGMFSAADWTDRLTTAQTIVDDAERTKSSLLLLTTAPQAEASAIPPAPQPAATVRRMLNSLHPSPWSVDRAQAARQIGQLPALPFARIVYLADGVAQSGDNAFAQALRARGAVQEIRFSSQSGMVLAPVAPTSDGTMARLIMLPSAQPRLVHVVARATDGGTLAVIPVPVAANATQADVRINLPITVRNRIDTLSVQGIASAATTVLLDENTRLHPVGLLSSGGADTPLIGSVFYLRRALAPLSDLHEGTLDALLSRPLSVLIAPDGTLAGAQSQKTVQEWIKNGGTLIRFAGPALAGSQQDTSPSNPADTARNLLPVPLLDGARQLGGSMTWGTPQKLAPFEQESPFRGLDIPADVTVSRQVLASPSADLGTHVWARLADGTPLVTHAELGKGEVILFHVSSTADWSNLPLSGLFVAMLQRLTEHANGLNIPAENILLSPALTLDGEGIAGPPPPTARGIQGNVFATTSASPTHPPGLYGPTDGRRALNTAAGVQNLQPAPPVGTITDASGQKPDLPLGRYCLLAAILLLLLDGVVVGLMRTGRLFAPRPLTLLALVATLGALTSPLHAQELSTPPAVPAAALETRLGYIVTGHEDVDTASREGLQGLSDFVNARTSAVMGHPDAVHPGTDDLTYYPLLYWPITADATTTPAMTAALNTFMAHGGILLIDTQGQDGSTSTADTTFTADAPGTTAALRRVTTGLAVPPLVVMTDHHLLAHTFYLLHDFPGRYAGLPIWVAKEGDAENDDVSPVIIGSADWAHAWAVDSAGNTPFAVIPGGSDQRLQAYRFGLNTVIYALTGSYKADQVHVPMLLKRLEDKP